MKFIKTNQTKRKPNKKKNLKKIWDAFDTEEIDKTKKLELLYSKSDIGLRDYCDLCNHSVAYMENKLLTCTNSKCGVIYKDVLDQAAEWRYYGAEDSSMVDPTRCGMPINPLLRESSYGCKVVCNGRSTWEMRKIRRYTEWQSMPYKEKAQYDEFEKIKALSKNAGIPKIIIDEALRQHKNLSELKTFRGGNREGIIAASVYIAGRIHNYPRTAKEIATVFVLDNTNATKGCKNAVSLLNKMEEDDGIINKTKFFQTKPTAFIERYCSKLNLNKELTMVCQFVARKIEQNNIIPENTPHSVAAGIVYFVAQTCNLHISKKNINSVCGVSEVTINKCYKKLDKIKEDLIPQTILKKYAE
jgi:transcription initiation factor TFIIIB Brf1 subunit/transcription initiation factor TFIIB